MEKILYIPSPEDKIEIIKVAIAIVKHLETLPHIEQRILTLQTVTNAFQDIHGVQGIQFLKRIKE